MSRPSAKFIDKPFPYHAELVLDIESVLSDGRGMGRIDGWVVMVPFSLKGETVKTRIYRNHSDYSEGDLIEVINASPQRAVPVCPLFTECGGCQYQHMAYKAQLELKTAQVAELLERSLKTKYAVRPAIGSPRTYHYRSKLTPHYEKLPEFGQPIGFLKNGQRRSLIDVLQCPLATEAINAALPAARQALHNKAKSLKKGGTLLLRDTPAAGVLTENGATALETVGDFLFQFQAGEFFQNNPFILPLLVDYVTQQAFHGGAMRYLIDAYCGVGMFGICANKRFERIMGIEVNANAVHWARVNTAMNQVKNIDFLIGDAHHIFDNVNFPASETACVIDPPRSGCSEDFLKQLVAYRPARLVYVSCAAATQARDAAVLLRSGYVIEEIQPFDLFPQTKHIESVITFARMDL